MLATPRCTSKAQCPLCRSRVKAKLILENSNNELYLDPPLIRKKPITKIYSDQDDSTDDSSNQDDSSDQDDSEVVYFDENQFSGIAELFANYDIDNPDHPYYGNSPLNMESFNVWPEMIISSDDSDENQFLGIAELFANYDIDNPDHPYHEFSDLNIFGPDMIINSDTAIYEGISRLFEVNDESRNTSEDDSEDDSDDNSDETSFVISGVLYGSNAYWS